MTVQQKLQPTTNLPTNDSTAVQFDCKPLLSLNKQRKSYDEKLGDSEFRIDC